MLNAYLERSGDYGGAALLPFYLVYRAMVRAKVAAIRAAQPGVSATVAANARSDCAAHLELAQSLLRRAAPLLMITHGVSGCGKTHVSGQLIAERDWIRVRADVERKRMPGLAPLERSGAGIGQGLYSAAAIDRVYDRLATLASTLLNAGASVIVDATFLKRSQRDRLRCVARRHGVGFAILALDAGTATHASRIVARQENGVDASEADTDVLAMQMAAREPLQDDESSHTQRVDTGADVCAATLAGQIEARAARMTNDA